MSKVWKKVKKIVAPVAIAAAVIYTGGAALSALGVTGGAAAGAGAAGAASLGSGATTAGLLAAPVGTTAGITTTKIAASGGLFAGIGGAIKTATPYLGAASAASQVIGAFGSSGQVGRVAPQSQANVGAVEASSEIATASSPQVTDEERRRRAIAANATNRQSTIRAGSLAQRPVLGAAGLLG